MAKHTQSDEELMKAYQSGSVDAFNELYDRYRDRVYGYLAKRVGSESDRDDVFQATFLKLHRSRHRYSDRFSFAQWIFTITRSVFLDYMKSKDKLEALGEPHLEGVAGDLAPPSEMFSVQFQNVSDRQQTALKMRYAEGLEFEEIAKRMNSKANTIRQLISRAVRKLRRAYGS